MCGSPEAKQRPAADAGRGRAREARGMITRRLGLTLLALAGALAAPALLGPLVGDVIHWRITPTVLSQLYGLDAVSLFLVAPLAAVAGVLALRGHPLGALLGFAPAVYATYMVPQYVLGPDYLGLPGDNERWFLLLLALFVLGLVAAVLAWNAMDPTAAHGSPRTERRVARRLLPVVGLLVFVRYPPTLTDWMSADPAAKDYLAGPTFGWTIALLDLGIALPATVAVCLGHRHGAAWARRGLYALIGWYALVGSAVAGMAVAMQLRDDPAMALPQMIVMTVLGALMLALAVTLYAPALTASRAQQSAPRPSRRRPSWR
jgi:hypothetical protein